MKRLWRTRRQRPRLLLPSLLAVCLLSLALPAGAQDKIGETVYREGEVSLDRNGTTLDPSAVEIGSEIDNYDFMKTGDDGSAQVHLTAPRVPSTTISISPDTEFTFELSTIRGRQHGSLDLVNGSVGLTVSKLGGNQDFDVQTETTTLGVRGTEFTASSSISGDVLVTCASGEVVATDSAGTQYRAIPGTVLENRAGRAFRTLPVASSDLESYRRTWMQDRAREARTNALQLTRANAARYQQLRAAMDRDYAELDRQKAITARWMAEDRAGRAGGGVQVENEKSALAATIARLRQEQFQMERVYYRLQGLKRLHDQGFGHGTISGAQSTGQFFDRFQQDRRVVEGRMSTVRYVARLYARRNNGLDPTTRALATRNLAPARETPAARATNAKAAHARPSEKEGIDRRAVQKEQKETERKKLPEKQDQGPQ